MVEIGSTDDAEESRGETMRNQSIARRIAIAPTVAQATPRREASGMEPASLLFAARRVASAVSEPG